MLKNRGAAIALLAFMAVPIVGGLIASQNPPTETIQERRKTTQNKKEAKSDSEFLEIAKYCDAEPDDQKLKWVHKFVCDVSLHCAFGYRYRRIDLDGCSAIQR